MTYNSLVSKRFATYQSNIALLDNCTNVSLNTKEIKHHLSTSKQSHTCKNWRYELLSTNSCLDDYLQYCALQEIHPQTLSLHQRHQSIFSDHVSSVHKGLQKNSQTQNNQKWNNQCLKYGLRTTNPSKSLPWTLHFIFKIHCVVICLCVECLGSHWQQKEISSWAIRCTYSKILIGVLKQWPCPNELIFPHGGKANEKSKTCLNNL